MLSHARLVEVSGPHLASFLGCMFYGSVKLYLCTSRSHKNSCLAVKLPSALPFAASPWSPRASSVTAQSHLSHMPWLTEQEDLSHGLLSLMNQHLKSTLPYTKSLVAHFSSVFSNIPWLGCSSVNSPSKEHLGFPPSLWLSVKVF